MTNIEKECILRVCEKIDRFASLENARFCVNGEEDQRIKKQISSYMTWFESFSDSLRDLANAKTDIEKYKAVNFIRECYRWEE